MKSIFFQGKIEDLANRTKIGPDSEQCLYLPPREGKRGVWLQPVRTFADYMEGVRFAIICSMMRGGDALSDFFFQGLMAEDDKTCLIEQVTFVGGVKY